MNARGALITYSNFSIRFAFKLHVRRIDVVLWPGNYASTCACGDVMSAGQALIHKYASCRVCEKIWRILWPEIRARLVVRTNDYRERESSCFTFLQRNTVAWRRLLSVRRAITFHHLCSHLLRRVFSRNSGRCFTIYTLCQRTLLHHTPAVYTSVLNFIQHRIYTHLYTCRVLCKDFGHHWPIRNCNGSNTLRSNSSV